MPPYEEFSKWLETICSYKRSGNPAAGQTILPTIGDIKKQGWFVMGAIPPNPFVEIVSWNHSAQTGTIHTNNPRHALGPTVHSINHDLLSAVYARFSQLALAGSYKGQPIATINSAYNKGLPHCYCWEPGKFPGDGTEVPVTCPHQIICPFLAPIVFRFCGGTTHNAAARAFSIAHGLDSCIP
ncbi:MAG: hypothetical protein RL088_542 [Verrucomicrobiota bacterium]|jgi:hypothetical protein